MDRELLETRGDAARLLQPPDAVLDRVASPVRGAVERRPAPGSVCATLNLVAALGDHGAHAVPAKPRADTRVAVAPVAGEGGGPSARPAGRVARDADGVEHLRGVAALVRLPGAERNGEWQARAVRDEVQLGGEPAAAAPQGVVGRLAGRLVFPPRPRRRDAPGRGCRRCTRVASRSGRPCPAHTGASRGCGPRAPRASSVGSASARSTTARSGRGGRATGTRSRGGRACR